MRKTLETLTLCMKAKNDWINNFGTSKKKANSVSKTFYQILENRVMPIQNSTKFIAGGFKPISNFPFRQLDLNQPQLGSCVQMIPVRWSIFVSQFSFHGSSRLAIIFIVVPWEHLQLEGFQQILWSKYEEQSNFKTIKNTLNFYPKNNTEKETTLTNLNKVLKLTSFL